MNNLPKEVKTNRDFVDYVMEFSPHGALTQAFVIESLRFYSMFVIENMSDKDDPNSFVNPKLWKGVAEDVLESWRSMYEKPKPEEPSRIIRLS